MDCIQKFPSNCAGDIWGRFGAIFTFGLRRNAPVRVCPNLGFVKCFPIWDSLTLAPTSCNSIQKKNLHVDSKNYFFKNSLRFAQARPINSLGLTGSATREGAETSLCRGAFDAVQHIPSRDSACLLHTERRTMSSVVCSIEAWTCPFHRLMIPIKEVLSCQGPVSIASVILCKFSCSKS